MEGGGIAQLHPHDLNEHDEQGHDTLEERDFSWWTKQLGHEPGFPGVESDDRTTVTRPAAVDKEDSRRGVDPRVAASSEPSQPEVEQRESVADVLKLTTAAAAHKVQLSSEPRAGQVPEKPLRLAEAPSARLISATDRDDAQFAERGQAQHDQPVPHLDPVASLHRPSAMRRLLYQVDALCFSRSQPYVGVRYASGYLLLCGFAAILGWLLTIA